MSAGQNRAVTKSTEPNPRRHAPDPTVDEIRESLDEIQAKVGALDDATEARAKFEQLKQRSNANGPAIGSTLPPRGQSAGMPVLLQLFGLGFELISYIIAATLLGWGVGYLVSNTRVGLLIGIVVGAIIGMIQMVRSAYRLTEPKTR